MTTRTILGGCPDHPDVEPECGYGMAGGGLGAYMYCPVCGMVLDKTEDPGPWPGDEKKESGE